MLGSLGFMELVFILALALLIFGPKRLPEVGRTLGRGMAEFRRATSDLKRTIEQEVDLEDKPARVERTRKWEPPSASLATTDARSGSESASKAGPEAEPSDSASSASGSSASGSSASGSSESASSKSGSSDSGPSVSSD